MISAIAACFGGSCGPIPEDYQALQKKDEDIYVRKIESWKATYQIETVDTDEQVERMVEDISKIFINALTVPDFNYIEKVFRGVASKTQHHKKVLMRLLRQKPNSQLWLDSVYTAFPRRSCPYTQPCQSCSE